MVMRQDQAGFYCVKPDGKIHLPRRPARINAPNGQLAGNTIFDQAFQNNDKYILV